MIQVKKLSKRYGNLEAVHDVSFSIGTSRVLGLLGPNGAGKTSIIKILAGIMMPSSGSIYINGKSLEEHQPELKQLIGYMGENAPLYPELDCSHYLGFIAETHLLDKKIKQQRIETVTKLCQLTSVKDQRIANLSKGYRQRLALAQALIHDPPVLILDEPSNGLDPQQTVQFRTLIKNLMKDKTIVLSTHLLHEAEAVCTDLLIMDNGRLACSGTPADIAGALKHGVHWTVRIKCPDKTSLDKAISNLDAALVLDKIMPDNKSGVFLLRMHADSEDIMEHFFDWSVISQFKILEITKNEMNLEKLYSSFTSGAEHDFS